MPETLTADQQSKVDYFRASVRLQSPDTETDPDYIFTDEELLAILKQVAPTHNREYTLETVPDAEFQFVIMLAKKEIFYRLATTTAPFYPIEADGASLNKNVRFDHYIALVQQIEKDYNNAIDKWKESAFGTATSYESTVKKHHFTHRNYNQSNLPTVDLTLSNPTSHTIDCDWTKFSVHKGIFGFYKLFVSKNPVIDEYEKNPIGDISAEFMTHDIHRLKYRLRNLEPNTTYYVVIASYDRNGRFGYSEQQIATLPIS